MNQIPENKGLGSTLGREGAGQAPCYTSVGTYGDGSCPELTRHVVCLHCPEFAARGRELLDRPLTDDYTRMWTQRLAQRKQEAEKTDLAVVVFQVQAELLALPSDFLSKVRPFGVIRRVPGRTTEIFLGLANVDGELVPAVNLAAALDFSQNTREAGKKPGRLLVAQDEAGAWAFPVDRVLGLARLEQSRLEQAPVTVFKAQNTCCRGVFEHAMGKATLLDPAKILMVLEGSLT